MLTFQENRNPKDKGTNDTHAYGAYVVKKFPVLKGAQSYIIVFT